MSRTSVAPLTAILSLLLATTLSLPVVVGTHADGRYDQPVWFEWNTMSLDVLVIPPPHGQLVNGNGALGGTQPTELTIFNSYVAALRAVAADWDAAATQFGPAWLSDLDIRVTVLGQDIPTVPALANPEIVIAFDETKTFILGITFSTRPCLTLNSVWLIQSFTANEMYSVAGHELGHCLGLEHVGGEHPTEDILDATIDEPIGAAANPKFCVSNLNVAGLVGVFADAAGQPGGGQTGTVATGSYAKAAAC